MIAIKQEKKNINKRTENAIKPSFVGGGAGFFTEGVGDGNECWTALCALVSVRNYQGMEISMTAITGH